MENIKVEPHSLIECKNLMFDKVREWQNLYECKSCNRKIQLQWDECYSDDYDACYSFISEIKLVKSDFELLEEKFAYYYPED